MTSCCGSSCGCAAPAIRPCGRWPRVSTRACTRGSRKPWPTASPSGELRDCDVTQMADRLLALIDGYGIRVLAGDPHVPIERARAEIWAAVAGDLGLA